MNKFSRVPLGEIAPKRDAKMPSSSEFVWNLSLEDIEPQTARVVRRQSCTVSALGSAKCSFDERHVLYSKLRPYLNKVVLPDGRGVGTSELLPLLPDPQRMDREFLAFYLRSPNFVDFAVAISRGANLPRVAMGALWTHKVPIPSLDEQRRIVRRIGECMERIDEAHTLRSNALTEARLLLPSVLNDMERGHSWPHTSIGEVLTDTKNGRSVRTSSESANGRVLTLTAVRGVDLDIDACKVAHLDHELISKYQVRTNDVFVSRSNTRDLVGLSSIAAGPVPPNTIYPDLLIKIQPDTSKVIPRFLAFILRCPSVRKQIQDRATGTSQSMVKISGRRLREVMIPLPLPEEQRRVLVTLDEALEVSNQVLSGLQASVVETAREAVLRRAFAGDL